MAYNDSENSINLKQLDNQNDNRIKSIINSQKSKDEQENEKVDDAINRRNDKKVKF